MKSIPRIIPIACVLAWAMLVPAAGPAHAHPADETPPTIEGAGGHDRPGPPPIITTVTLVWVDYPYQLYADDAGSYIEMYVNTGIEHDGHGMDTRGYSNDLLRWPNDGGSWLLFEDVYSHLECSPMNPLHIELWGIEADATNLSDIEEQMLKLVVDLTYNDRYLIGKDAILKLLRKFFAWVNPDDTLGYGDVVAPAPGGYTVTTAHGDYSISAYYEVTAPAQNTNECNPETPMPAASGPDFGFSTGRFDRLIPVHEAVNDVDPETGAIDLSPQDMEDARTSVRSLTVGMAQWLAGHMVEQAQPYYGASSALYYFNQASSESGTAAISDYRQAFANAHYALDNFGIDPSAQPMAPVAAALPAFIATRSGRSVDYLIGVFGTGAENVSIASVTGGPPGAVYTIVTADPEHPWIKFLHVDQNAPQGTYTIYVTFSGGSSASSTSDPAIVNVAPLTLTLDLDEVKSVTAVHPGGRSMPSGFALAEILPNPVRSVAAIRVELPVQASVALSLFDVAGHLVRTVAADYTHGAGTSMFRLDTQGLAAGVYYLRLVARPTAGGMPYRASRTVIVTH